jgi:DNA topoisomerase-1
MNHSIYLKDPGIYKKNNVFYYNFDNKRVTDPSVLSRLNSFRVPPAWEKVWYSSNKKCHVQIHGIDQSGKKQYILSEEWIKNARYQKYNRMKLFMKDLVNFKKKIKSITLETTYENVLKLLFNLLIDTHIRVGNEKYAESNGTYGLTTLRQKHFINDSFVFTGKSGVYHSVSIPGEYLQLLRKLKLTGSNKPLFWYLNGHTIKTISSEELNEYLKKQMGKDYTCKDFRTYSANVLFIKAFLKNSKILDSVNKINKINSVNKIILKSIDDSAKELGHSRNISRKSYISNNLLDYCMDSFDSAIRESSSSLLSRA